MNSMAKRLDAFEVAAEKVEGPGRINIIRVIIAPDRSIIGAMRRGEHGELVPVSEGELADIRRRTQLSALFDAWRGLQRCNADYRGWPAW